MSTRDGCLGTSRAFWEMESCSKGQRHGRVLRVFRKRKKLAVTRLKCVSNTGAGDEVKRCIWVEFKDLFCHTKAF